MTKKEKLCLALYQAGCLKFGSFILKSGMKSPAYIDLRTLVSYPKTLKLVAETYSTILKKLKFDRLVAVPYSALPLTCAVSFLMNKPWIYTRKEVKTHGIKKPVEGLYNKGDRVVIIDDMITNGDSKLEIINSIKTLGVKIKDIVVLVDREQGGKENLKVKGYQLHAVLNFSLWLKVLKNKKILKPKKYQETLDFLRKTRVK